MMKDLDFIIIIAGFSIASGILIDKYQKNHDSFKDFGIEQTNRNDTNNYIYNVPMVNNPIITKTNKYIK